MIISFLLYQTSLVSPIPQMNPLNPSYKLPPPLSYDTPNETFIHMGGNISDLPDLKKQMIALDIERRRDNDIIEK